MEVPEIRKVAGRITTDSGGGCILQSGIAQLPIAIFITGKNIRTNYPGETNIGCVGKVYHHK